MASWMSYKNAANITDIFDLDTATRFRHVEEGDSSFIEIHTPSAVHTVMWITDRDAFHRVIDYVKKTTGISLE